MATRHSADSRPPHQGRRRTGASPLEEDRAHSLEAIGGHALEVRRLIPASRERVFDAWTRADLIPQWFTPGPTPLRSALIDLRVGGEWRMAMGHPDEAELVGTGVFLAVDRPSRLVYTWNWEPDPVGNETIVSIDFIDRHGDTEIVLRHAGFPAPRVCEGHRHGWTNCLSAMTAMFGATVAGEVRP